MSLLCTIDDTQEIVIHKRKFYSTSNFSEKLQYRVILLISYMIYNTEMATILCSKELNNWRNRVLAVDRRWELFANG